MGHNWAYGRATVSGCATISVGDLNDPFHNPIGPQLRNQAGVVWDDDEFLTTYHVYNGTVWDDTDPAPGDGLYKVFEFAQSQDAPTLAVAQSPCYC